MSHIVVTIRVVTELGQHDFMSDAKKIQKTYAEMCYAFSDKMSFNPSIYSFVLILSA